MILECPSCENRYLVDPRALGKSGRTVRCARCKHQWFAESPREKPEPDVLPVTTVEDIPSQQFPPIPPGSSVPAIAGVRQAVPQGIQWAAVAMLVLFLGLAFVYFRPLAVQAVPSLKGTYAALGMYDTRGVVFANLEYAQTKSMSRDSHRVEGYMVNTAPEPRRLPMISISLFSRDGSLMRRVRIVEQGWMAPGEQRQFSRELTASPESARRVVVEAGSPFELKLR